MKSQYGILRFAKYKGPEIGRIEAHNERTKETYASNPDVDTGKSRYNLHLVTPQRSYRAEAERHGNKYVITRDQAAFCREVTAYLRLPRTSTPTEVRVTGEELNRAVMAANLAKKAKF